MSTAARLLRSWVQIPPQAWISVCCECCVLSGRDLWDELITRPEKSYRLWSVVVCDIENQTSWMRRPRPTGGLSLQKKVFEIISLPQNLFYITVYGLSRDFVFFSAFAGELYVRAHWLCSRPVFLNHRAAVRYRTLASNIPGRERSEESTICYKISLVQLIINLNVILYLSKCHTLYISVLIFVMIMT